MTLIGWSDDLLRLAAAGALSLGIMSFTPAYGQCLEGDFLIGETDVEYICRRAKITDLPNCGDIPQTIEGLQSYRDGLRLQLSSNVEQAARNADALGEWSNMMRDAQEDARKNALAGAIDMALGATLNRLSKGFAAAREARTLDAGLVTPEIGAIIDKLSRLSASQRAAIINPIAEANTAVKGIDALKTGMTIIDAAYDTGSLTNEKTWAQKKAAAVSLLKLSIVIAKTHPGIDLLVTDLSLAENALYGWWAVLVSRNRLKQFLALEDALLEESIRESNQFVLANNALRARRLGGTFCLN